MTSHSVDAAARAGLAVIPRPGRLTAVDAAPFLLDARTPIVADEPLKGVAAFLGRALEAALGGAMPIASASDRPAIHLKLDPGLSVNDEGYALSVGPDRVQIAARSAAGAFYGVQTLRQLLPAAVFGPRRCDDLTIPAVQIEDQPRFGWRGMHLDVSRHFFSVAEVKQFIDLISLHKFNTFHWHLVDDQGWRIDIRKHPKLTEVGAWRSGIGFGFDAGLSTAYGPDGRYGGFYTQDDIREVVAFAAERFVTVVPEIEMPGHSTAALAAYPELSCSGRQFTTDIGGGVFPGVFCAAEPKVDQFIADVLGEVLELFPSRFIHVGGDEVPKDPWKACPKCQAYIKARGLKDEHELQSDFIRRADRFLTARGRRLIGWDEILEGGLAEGAAVMSWRGIDGGIAAARAGHDAVMSPGSHCYFDHYQGDPKAHPRAWGGYTPLRKVYAYEPVPDALSAAEARHILGAQGNLWSEWMPNYRQVEFMAFPRACALAEVVWSPKELRDWNDFRARLDAHVERLDALGVNRCPDAADAPMEKPADNKPAESKPAR